MSVGAGISLASSRRLAAAVLLGFASGLPLALSGTALQAWLTVSGVDVATIGFLTLIGLPYTFKFLWAPLMDRFEPPFLGRRRGWILVTQLALVAALGGLSLIPAASVGWLGAVAALVALLSASQDIVVDAWRTDALSAEERGLGASLGVLGYRVAMVLSGGIALIWADPAQGGMSWPEVYRTFALVLLGAAVLSVFVVPSVAARVPDPNATPARQELLGFGLVLLTAAAGWCVAHWPGVWITGALLSPFTLTDKLRAGWTDVGALIVGAAFALPVGTAVARRHGYATLVRSFEDFLTKPRARLLLLAVVVYKLGDAFALSLNTTFLLTGGGYTSAEVGVVNKVFGIWLTVLGSLLGGLLLPWLRLPRALAVFGLSQALAVVGFYVLAVVGRGAWGASVVPAFDLGFVWLKEAVDVDHGLIVAVALENLTSGMGTAAFVAFLMALARGKYTATQFALLSALAAVGRVWVGPFAGVLQEAVGWPTFFLVAIAAGLPGVALIWWLRREIAAVAETEG